jgi:hypothetical protein
LSYLLYGEVDDYVAIMDALESSVTHMSPADVTREVAFRGRSIAIETVEDRTWRRARSAAGAVVCEQRQPTATTTNGTREPA